MTKLQELNEKSYVDLKSGSFCEGIFSERQLNIGTGTLEYRMKSPKDRMPFRILKL